MKRFKLDAAQIAEIVRLREECRKPVKIIARRFGVSTSAINYQLLRNGVDPWDPDRNPPRQRQRNPFSPEEDARMLALGASGMAPHKIAEAIGRPKTSVLIRLMTLEVRAEKALEAA